MEIFNYSSTIYGNLEMKHSFNWELYRKYRDTRDNKKETVISDHPLVGKKFVRNNQVIVIQVVHKHWYFGYYEMALYITEHTQSHGTFFIRNISSQSKDIKSGVEFFQKEWKPLDD